MKNFITHIFAALLVSLFIASATYADAPSSVTLAGTMQSELGCPGDWQPSCATTHLTKNGSLWSLTVTVPAGNWEYKIALNDNWTESYGYNLSTNNAVFSLTTAKTVTFNYDENSHLVTDTSQLTINPQPTSVTIAGNLQKALGCTDDWLPDCTATQLAFDNVGGVWQKSFLIPAGNWQYKVALNNSWNENYGAHAKSNGDNILLSLAAPTTVKFIYNNQSHWVADNVNLIVATAVGNFQAALGCPADWSPDCLQTWLQDVSGNGLYTFTTTKIPVGSYEAKIALNESWAESYGNEAGFNINFTVSQPNQKVVFTYLPTTHKVYIGDEVVSGNLKTAKAYWLAGDTVAMDLPSDIAPTANVKLYFSPTGALTSSPDGIAGGDFISLIYDANGLSDAIKTKYRHLKNLPAFKIASQDISKIGAILKQQIAVSATTPSGKLIDATGLQFAGALDDLFAYSGDLGVIYNNAVPQLKLWAPTAKSVKVHVYGDATTQTETAVANMVADTATGVWSLVGEPGWNRKYYLYEVEVFVRSTGKIEHNWVTDPYSLALSTNGRRSMFVNLNDADLKPAGWMALAKPPLNSPEDAVIYELHVRDFSIADATVSEAQRGTFLAFTQFNSNGMKHLKKLADAGMTHVHLLPTFDCATINEIKSEQKTVTENLTTGVRDSESQQAAVNAIRGQDGFNWCYDPFHYTVPDGSYATDPEGVARIREFRAMVVGLNQVGLRVILDVVYNHTAGAFLSDTSVLDKVVPTYYHRLNANGDLETSTCCANTASENTMMEKLMLDSIKTWATQYKVDGFRYDIMGHHTKENIVKIKTEIQKLTPAAYGIEGSKIYFYGEGWNFGEVQNNSRFTQATIGNMSGTGIGTFNDRIRDAVRGGGCCDSGAQLVQNQSFITGLYTAPNAENSASETAKNDLLKAEDKLKIVLAGSLADYSVMDRYGSITRGSDIDGAGYTQDPSETINYVEAHDNETLFDIIQYKAPLSTSTADRVRMQNLGNSIVLLAQGIPFLQAGQDLLRSKSFDRNSYDSGDWFNALDFTYQTNGWGKGLPLAQENQNSWSIMQPRLANAALAPTPDDIKRAGDAVIELLKIRKSTKLFRLETAEQIKNQVNFYNTGISQIPGVIVMNIKESPSNPDIAMKEVVVFFNANPSSQTITVNDLKGRSFMLHPVQLASNDSILKQSSANNTTGTFVIPARTTAVFVVPKTTAAVAPKQGGGAFHGFWDCLFCISILRFLNQ